MKWNSIKDVSRQRGRMDWDPRLDFLIFSVCCSFRVLSCITLSKTHTAPTCPLPVEYDLFVSVQVSKKAMQLLAQVGQEPLLNLEQLNPELVTHAESMSQAHSLRQKLRLLGDYLLTCRSGACKKLQARCVCACVCNVITFFFNDVSLFVSFNSLSGWNSERTCWSRAICTVSWIFDR